MSYEEQIMSNFQDCARCEKELKNNKHNNLYFGAKIWSDIPWTLSVPRSSQFSSSYALGKLFATRNNVRGQIS